MENLKSNIDNYMKLKGIKMYSHLLVDIAHELGINEQDAYEFAAKEKSNFSKMLKGERPLKYEFIIPLEKIFGVSLARMLNENAYKLPVEKDNVPFNKGFRYYAYLDDPKLYREEFDLILGSDGKSIITKSDEFGKSFLDYVVEYNSVNGVRYMHDEYGIRLRWYHNEFEFNKNKGVTWICFENSIAFARLVASMNDTELFNDIYDSYYMFFSNGHYATKDCIFCQSEYLEIILDNDNLFNSIMKIKPYEYKLDNNEKRIKKVDSVTFNLVNPIINNCLRYALKHLDEYKHRAKDILKFGIRHNRKIADENSFADCYICNELGGLKKFKNEEFFDIAVFVDVNVKDNEIKSLINKLLKFNKR